MSELSPPKAPRVREPPTELLLADRWPLGRLRPFFSLCLARLLSVLTSRLQRDESTAPIVLSIIYFIFLCLFTFLLLLLPFLVGGGGRYMGPLLGVRMLLAARLLDKE